MVKDNPGIEKEVSTGIITRIIMYGGLVLCMILAVVRPIYSRSIVALMTMTMFVWTYIGSRIGSK